MTNSPPLEPGPLAARSTHPDPTPPAVTQPQPENQPPRPRPRLSPATRLRIALIASITIVGVVGTWAIIATAPTSPSTFTLEKQRSPLDAANETNQTPTGIPTATNPFLNGDRADEQTALTTALLNALPTTAVDITADLATGIPLELATSVIYIPETTPATAESVLDDLTAPLTDPTTPTNCVTVDSPDRAFVAPGNSITVFANTPSVTMCTSIVDLPDVGSTVVSAWSATGDRVNDDFTITSDPRSPMLLVEAPPTGVLVVGVPRAHINDAKHTTLAPAPAPTPTASVN